MTVRTASERRKETAEERGKTTLCDKCHGEGSITVPSTLRYKSKTCRKCRGLGWV